METILRIVIYGLGIGSIYALIAIGYSMVYGILRLMNFAHGDVYMFGTFVAYVLLTTFQIGMILSIGIALTVGGLLGMLVERVAYRPLRAYKNRSLSMITALGAAYVIQNFEELLFGIEVRRFPEVIPNRLIPIFNINLPLSQLTVLLISVLLLLAFNTFLKYHKVGKAILCMAQDLGTSSLMGIPINRTISIIYFLGGTLGVAGGILFTSSYNFIAIHMGFAGTVYAFTASIFGGIGNLNGAVLGGFILGMLYTIFDAFFPSAFRDILSYSVLFGVLLIKPTGLLPQWEIGEKV